MKINKISLKLSIFFFILLSNKKVFKIPSKINPFYTLNRPILSLNKNQLVTLTKGREYIDKCLETKDIYNYNNNITNPEISVIIPLYNCQKTIRQSLLSVQFQNYSNFEIILINDNSTDNTSKLIDSFKEKDKRIKIINNNKNMGTLYSRAIGVLISKGRYIFGLDNDDMYFDVDLLDYIYHIAINEKLDIVGFLTIHVWDYGEKIKAMKDIYSYLYPDTFFVKQPKLGNWMIEFQGKYIIHNNMIWDKCIKSFIYKKAINLMGIERYSKYVSWAEDTSVIFIIFNICQNFKYIHKYGIFHLRSNSTASLRQSDNIRIFGELFFLDIMLDFSKNNIVDKNLIIQHLFYIKSRHNLTLFNDSNSFYLKYLLNKIFVCKYIKKINKRKIKKNFNSYFI